MIFVRKSVAIPDQLIESIENQEKKELVLKILYKKKKMKQRYSDAFDRAEELIEMSTDDLQKLAEEAEEKSSKRNKYIPRWGKSMLGKKSSAKLIFATMIVILIGIYIIQLNNSSADFDTKPGYEQLLNRVIAEKNDEIRLAEEKEAGDDYFIVTQAMKEDPKYREPDGSLNYEAICKDVGYSLTLSPEGALNEIHLTVVDGSIGPHVLGHAEAAVYSDEEGAAWSLKKGDKITFRVYADKEYYKSSGHLYFGALKMGEPFLVDNLDKGITVETETEFVYDVTETGDYHFYLFCGSTEPIIIKWIYISIR